MKRRAGVEVEDRSDVRRVERVAAEQKLAAHPQMDRQRGRAARKQKKDEFSPAVQGLDA